MRFLLFMVFSGWLHSCAQDSSLSKILRVVSSLPKDNLFFLCRGTVTKGGIVAKKFNLYDSLITHVAIGFFENEQLKVFHVSDTRSVSGHYYREDSLPSFLNQDRLNFFSVWGIQVNEKEIGKVKEICIDMKYKNIVFDFSFILNNEWSLYCSEFCLNVLLSIDKKKYSIKPSFKKLDGSFYEKILKRNTLYYIPVDFFRQYNFCKKYIEFHF